MAKMGRPNAVIDKNQFEQLCRLQCTETEICEWFGITDKTLCKWTKSEYGATFSEIYKQKRTAGHISLRRFQFQQAEHNPTMAIWLGKQWLGQRDNKDLTVNTISAETIAAVEEFMNGDDEEEAAGAD